MKHPQWFQYQFYEGKAFQPGDWDYSDRLSKMNEELISAATQIKGTDKPVLTKDSIGRLYEDFKESIRRERLLYKELNINNVNMPRLNLEQIENYIDQMRIVQVSLTNSFNDPKNQGKAALLAILNDKDFITHIAGEVTWLSFTKYGESFDKDRGAGKETLSRAVNKGLNLSGKDKNSEIIALLQKDFGEGFQNELIDFDLNKYIKDLLEEIFGQLTLRKKRYNSEKRMAAFNSVKGLEVEVKKFYKRLYRTIREKLKVENRTFLDGALYIADEFQGTEYAQEILCKIYDYNSQEDIFNQKAKIKTGITSKNIANIIYKFLSRSIGNYQDKILSAAAKTYLVDFSSDVLSALEEAYERQKAKDRASSLAAFNKSAVSGVLGEFAAILSLSSKDKFRPILLSNNLNKLGQKEAVDISLEIIQNNKVKSALGIQVKNYTASNSIELYSDTQVSLTDNDIKRYMNWEDLKLFKFMVANSELASEVFKMRDYEKEALVFILYNYVPAFIREKDLSSESKQTNTFYYINNQIYPVSLFLAQIIKGCLEIINRVKDERLFSLINIPKYEAIDSSIKGEKFSAISAQKQPRANKRINNITLKNLRARSFKEGGIRYPKEVDSVLQNTYIKFHGITVKIF